MDELDFLNILDIGNERSTELRELAQPIIDCIQKNEEPPKLPDTFAHNFFRTGMSSFMLGFELRSIVTGAGMWAYASKPFLDELAKALKGKKVLDPFAGRGWISRGLRNRGIEVIATDLYPQIDPLIETEHIDALESVKKYISEVDIILLSWVPYGCTLDHDILVEVRKHPNKEIIWIGEVAGTSGTDEFCSIMEYVENDGLDAVRAEFQSFHAIHDSVFKVQ